MDIADTDEKAICSKRLSEPCIRLEVEYNEDLCLRLFVPHDDSEEVEVTLEADIGNDVLRQFSLGVIPDFLFDVLQNSASSLFNKVFILSLLCIS